MVEGLLVTGRVGATAVVGCVRCLRGFDHELEVEVRELFALQPGDDEDEGYAVLPDDRLPLDTMARDALVLAAFPLCRPDCAGLCCVCGADHQRRDYGHGGSTSTRWAGPGRPANDPGGRRCPSPSVRPAGQDPAPGPRKSVA